MRLTIQTGILTAELAVRLLAQAPEVSSRDVDMPASFRTKVNLVLVPVVVRDKKGQAIGTLKRENFELFDKGKPQGIAKFSVEQAGSLKVEFEPSLSDDSAASEAAPPAGELAQRFTIFLFDDLHLNLVEIMNARQAAKKYLAADGVAKSERIGVYTTSGRLSLPLTIDSAQISAALEKIQPAGKATEKRKECPPMTYFQAYSLERCEDSAICQPREIGVNDAYQCAGLVRDLQRAVALSMTKAAARQTAAMAETENRETFANLNRIVRGLASMPGERNLLIVSPGIYSPGAYNDLQDVITLAIRARVVINSLDAKGLSTAGNPPDASERVFDKETILQKASYQRWEAEAAAATLEELADGTGGRFFTNDNGLAEGFRRLTGTPEYTYILGFSPLSLKYDGSLHTLKVKVRNGAGLSVQARRAYYAPKQSIDPAEDARREIEEAMFSREVMHDLPVELHSQYFKSGEFDAKLTVLVRVNVANLTFQKEDGRNGNDLTLVAALFDKDGNMLKGSKKLVELRLKDETLADKTRAPITFKMTFDVKIGGYVIRLVVRDREGQLMSAQNGSVVIP